MDGTTSPAGETRKPSLTLPTRRWLRSSRQLAAAAARCPQHCPPLSGAGADGIPRRATSDPPAAPCRIGGALTPLAGCAASGAPQRCGLGVRASAQPPKPPKGFTVKSSVTAPAAGPVSAATARLPPALAACHRLLSILPPPSPPQGGALSSLRSWRCAASSPLQPLRVFRSAARAAAFAPPRRWPPSANDRTTRSTSPCSVASASPPGWARESVAAGVATLRPLHLSYPPAHPGAPSRAAAALGASAAPLVGSPPPPPPKGGSRMPLKQAICSTGAHAAS
jgi:hypothetical protein